MSNLTRLISNSRRTSESQTYLLYKLPTANHNRRRSAGVITLSICRVRCVFKSFRDDELKFPSTLLPQIIKTRYPASCCVRRRGRGISMRYTLTYDVSTDRQSEFM